MLMNKKVYYYSFRDLDDSLKPFQKLTLSTFLLSVLNEENLTGYQLPSDFTTNADTYNELFSLFMGRYYEHAFLKIEKCYFEAAPSDEEIEENVYHWAIKLMSLLNMTYSYYTTLLNVYKNAISNLMDDITATSKNKIRFNDTPQNANTSGVYEGDNYISQFTATEGETSSPLMSKIMRLKEIQDHYKDVMTDWVSEFEKIFYQVEV